jgi:hypothetical protein
MPDLTFNGLQIAVSELAIQVARSADAIRSEVKAIEDEADATVRDAECLASYRVDKASVSEAHELAQIIRGLSDATLDHALTAVTTARQADAVFNQNQISHGGINEAVNRSSVGREIYDVDRRWCTPE